MSARLLDLRARIGGVVSGDTGLFPGPGHSRKDRSLSVRDVGSRLVVHSFAGDDLGAIFRYLESHGVNLPSKPQPLTATERMKLREMRVREEAERRALEQSRKLVARDLWRSAQPIGGAALAYLKLRGISEAVITQAAGVGDIRYHPEAPRAPYQTGSRTAPAMFGLVRDRWGGCLGLHITFVREDGGGKAFGDRSRLMVASQSGGCIRLAPVAETIAVAEGIETALSFASLYNVPTWAARSTDGLERFIAPAGVKEILIAADGDAAGKRAAGALYERLRPSFRMRLCPAPDGQDWNDVLMGRMGDE